jgi:hypothetical protein
MYTVEMKEAMDKLEGPAIPTTMDKLVEMCRNNGADGGTLYDKFFDTHMAQVHILLPNGKVRVYYEPTV